MTAFFWSLKPPAETDSARAERGRKMSLVLARNARLYLTQIDDFDQISLARYGHHTLGLPTGHRLAIIGDAAHSTSPQLGQGANMPLLDARALAHALERPGPGGGARPPMRRPGDGICGCSRRFPGRLRRSTNRIRRLCPLSAIGSSRRSQKSRPSPGSLLPWSPARWSIRSGQSGSRRRSGFEMTAVSQ